MFKLVDINPMDNTINFKHKYKPLTVSFIPCNTIKTASISYRFNLLNKLNSVEITDVRVKEGGHRPSYETLALILFSIRKMAITPNNEPYIYSHDNKDKSLSTNLGIFLAEIQETSSLYIKVRIGKFKTPFYFSISRNSDQIQVISRIYHPEDVSPATVLKLLAPQINEQLKTISIILHRQKHFGQARCTVKTKNNLSMEELRQRRKLLRKQIKEIDKI